MSSKTNGKKKKHQEKKIYFEKPVKKIDFPKLEDAVCGC